MQKLQPTYTDIWTDSRKVTKGSLFICPTLCPSEGTPYIPTEENKYIQDALRKGAAGILYSCELDTTTTTLVISLSKKRSIGLKKVSPAELNPLTTKLLQKQYPISKKMKTVAITGTDGKSSTVHFCREIVGNCGYKAASIGTLGIFGTENGKTKKLFPSDLTTPDQATAYQLFNKLSHLNITHVFIEYSSIGILLNRLSGIPIHGAVFTTFGSDHLDYHKTVEEYRRQKNRLFSEIVDLKGFALVHEKVGDQEKMIHRAKRVLSIQTPETVYSPDGLILKTSTETIPTKLFATFLTENLNTAITICQTLGINKKLIYKAAANISGPSGRFEVINKKDYPLIIIDYAHTPAGLERLLEEVARLKKEIGRTKVNVLVGAGGDRDKTKRPLFGKIASKYADRIIVTDDNPRTEPLAPIRKAIVDGIPKKYTGIVKNINGREKAIASIIKTAKSDEIIVLAGKGHETYQIIGKTKFPFDERVMVKQAFADK